MISEHRIMGKMVATTELVEFVWVLVRSRNTFSVCLLTL